MPVDVRPRIHALAIDEFDGTASLDTAVAITPMFGIAEREARTIVAEVGRAVSGWREAASRLGIKPDEIDRMASAFDHEDLRAATA